MTFDSQILENLLHQPEGPALDFKQAQYRFNGANEADKSEILKDVLAMANSWRLTTAYILIGVQEVKGSRSKVIGVDQHLDDAALHQFVNSKTQRPVQFLYQQFPIEGVEIGVIQIPVQTRPLFVTKQFGRLQPNAVKVRDGSSTRTATPEEVAKMGADQALSDAPYPAPGLGWTQERIINSLQKSIDSIEELKDIGDVYSPEYRAWHRATLYTIKTAFGDRGIHYWDFRDIVDEIYPTGGLYGVMGWRLFTGFWKQRIPQKLDEARELLTSIVDEVKLYETYEKAQNGVHLSRVNHICRFSVNQFCRFT